MIDLRPENLQRLTLVGFLLFVLCSCTGDEVAEISEPSPTPPQIKVEGPKVTAPGRNSEKTSPLQSLSRIINNRPSLSAVLRGTRAILVAEEFDQRGEKQAAVKAWNEALTANKGVFGRMAFEGWLRAYTEHMAKKMDVAILARMVMLETNYGQDSPYMRESGLITEESVRPQLSIVASKWLTPEPREATSSKIELPPKSGIPLDDPLLTQTIQRACQHKSPNNLEWENWKNTLPSLVQGYWQALVTQICDSDSVSAISQFRTLYPKLAKSTETLNLAIESASRCALLQRQNGQRAQAAETYMDLDQLWAMPNIDAKGFAKDKQGLTMRRIDETLWAARSRALIGDLENAKILAQKGLDLTKELSRERQNLKPGQIRQLASLTADAYHTLASRIAVEQKRYNSAVSLTSLALKTPGITVDWQERLSWASALYEYLDGNFASAQNHWERLQQTSNDENLRIAAKYWSARCLQNLGNAEIAQRIANKLIEQHPFNYYSVIAATSTLTDSTPRWNKPFPNLATLDRNLKESHNFQLELIRSSLVLGPLLSRAEALIAANIEHLSRLAVTELESAMNSRLAPNKNISAFVYLSRLQYRAGLYLASIGTTNKIAKINPEFWNNWPEQILVFFPQPFSQVYSEKAKQLGLSKSLLLGISRQESGFTADIRSPANAIGIMQLIRPTAKKYADALGLGSDNLEQMLLDPSGNIQIGSTYLKALSDLYQGFPPAIFGAYNAGEFAMNSWLKRRGHPDPLVFVELIPFGESREYIKNVWRNVAVYDFLGDIPQDPLEPGFDLGFAANDGA